MTVQPYRAGDRVKLWTGCPRPLPDDLIVDQTYVVEDTVLDRIQINGKLYFASRFMLLGETR